MRTITKSIEPRALSEWRARYHGDPNFGYDLLRKDRQVIDAVTESLLIEQGFLCAYTGRRVRSSSCHVEHIKAQAHCDVGEDVAYSNLLACYPQPNTTEAKYGAHQKKSWPAPPAQYLFVSPLSIGCENRFLFNLRGKISAADGDVAADTTIKKLELCHRELSALRKAAIQGVLGQNNNLSLVGARKRLRQIEGQTTGEFEPFCFVIKQALRKHIQRLEMIAQQRRSAR